MIGSDHYWEFVTNEIICGEKGPATVTVNLVGGPVKGTGSNDVITDLIIEGSSVDVTSLDSDGLLTNSLKQLWETESIGIMNEEISDPSVKGPFHLISSLTGYRRGTRLGFLGKHVSQYFQIITCVFLDYST